MSTENNSAFPIAWHPEMGWDYSRAEMGLSKRELIAAMAMQGLCACSIAGGHKMFNVLAKEAVMYADALIEELDKCD
jgi:hypothetical protein